MKISEARKKILHNLLKNSGNYGLSDDALEKAAQDLGYEKEIAYVAFTKGIPDTIDYFAKEQREILAEVKFSSDMGLTRKIKALIIAHLQSNHENKAAIRALAAYYSMPVNVAQGVSNLYKLVDEMWYLAGDKSADFSFYTKRMTLAAILASTVTYWLGDYSEDMQDTKAFLERRLQDIVIISKIRAKFGLA